MSVRILWRRLARNFQTLVSTCVGYRLYTVGCWLQGKSAKPKRPDDPAASAFYDMEQYGNMAMLQHSAEYMIVKNEAIDRRRPYPSREEFDVQKKLPPLFVDGDKVDLSELNFLCHELNLDVEALLALAQENNALVMNFLRLRYWNYRFPSRRGAALEADTSAVHKATF